jgi:hypothetical protein
MTDKGKLVDKILDLVERNKELEARLSRLVKAVSPLVAGLAGRPRSEWGYYLLTDHPAVAELVAAYKEATKDEQG